MKSAQTQPPPNVALVGTHSTFDEIFRHLEGATSAYAAAVSAIEAAEHHFFESGADADERMLDAARDSERKAANHLARARHLMGFAEVRRKAEERAELEEKLADCARRQAELEAKALELQDREAEAFVRVIDVREERLKVNQAIAAEKAKAGSISGTLGLPYTPFDLSMTEIEPIHFHVGQRLRQRAQGLPGQSPRVRWLYELAEGTPRFHPLDPAHPMRTGTRSST